MSTHEITPDDDPEQHVEVPPDEAADDTRLDLTARSDGDVDDGLVLRDNDAAGDEQFGELVDDADQLEIESVTADEVATDEPIDGSSTVRRESMTSASNEDRWATRPEREADIMGYAKVPTDVAEVGRLESDMQRGAQLSVIFGVGDYLRQVTDAEKATDQDTNEADGDAPTWTTPTGRVSVFRHPTIDESGETIRHRVQIPDGEEPDEGTLEVQAQQLVPYNDSGDIVEVNVRVSFQSEAGRVYWNGLSTGFTNPKDGSPCPEGEEAILGNIDPESLPPGVTVDQAIEGLLISYVWNNTMEAFNAANEEDEEIDEAEIEAKDQKADAVVAEIEAEIAEAAAVDAEKQSLRNHALFEAGEQLLAYERSDMEEFEPYTAARAYTNLIQLAGRMGNSELVAGFTERLEKVKEVPPGYLVQAYFVGSDAGDPEMLTKVDTLLTGEAIDRMDSDPEKRQLFGMSGLRQVVAEYEARGVSPDTLIMDRALDAEERWTLTAHHYSRMRDKDPDAAEALHRSIQQFARNDGNVYSPEFIAEMTGSTLYMTKDPALRAALVEQFTSAIDQLPVDSSSFYKLLNVGSQVLQDKELTQAGLAQQVRFMVDLQGDRLTDNFWLTESRREWNVKFLTHTDTTASSVAEGIKESTAVSIANMSADDAKNALAVDEARLFRAGAVAYAEQGKFAQSQELIAEMGLGRQADAYESCLGYAKSPWDIQRLRPKADLEAQVYDPDIAMLFEANEARISNDLSAMEAQVHKLSGIIAKARDDEGAYNFSPLPDATMCRTQAVRLLTRMKEIAPGSERAATRVFVKGMQRSAVYGSDLQTMSYSFDSLLESDDNADHEMVFRIIRDTDASPAKKAELYARLALRISD